MWTSIDAWKCSWASAMRPAMAMKSWLTSVRRRLAVDERSLANSPVASGLSMIVWWGWSPELRVRCRAAIG